MPDSIPKKRRAEADDHLYVRVRDGTVYGPVPIAELGEWAESGNIMPGDEVSADQKIWSPAAGFPELRMTVMIDRGDGSFIGPFNEKAVEPLVKSGAVSANAKRLAIEDICAPPAQTAVPKTIRHHADDSELQAEMEERIEAAAQQARDAIAERDREIDTLRDALAETQTALEEAQAAPAAETAPPAPAADPAIVKSLEAEIAERDALIKSLNEKIASRKIQKDTSESRVAELVAAIAEKDAALVAKDDAAAALEARCGELKTQIGELEKALADKDGLVCGIESQYGEKDAQIADLAGALEEKDNVIAGMEAQCGELQVRIGELSDALAEKDELLAGVETRGNETETRIAELRRTLAESAALSNAKEAKIRELEKRLNEKDVSSAIIATRNNANDARINKLQSELSTLVSEHSEFLDFANTRDSEYAAKVASLETALAKATDENAALKNDHTRAVAELIALIRQLTADEAARVAAAQTASARFQAAVIDCVNKMEQTGGQDPLIVERRETARRISALEIKLEQTRARLEHAERHAADFDAISLRLKNKEAALSDAEQEFSVALLKWQAENQALKFRIEELEHEIGN